MKIEFMWCIIILSKKRGKKWALNVEYIIITYFTFYETGLTLFSSIAIILSLKSTKTLSLFKTFQSNRKRYWFAFLSVFFFFQYLFLFPIQYTKFK